MQHDIKLDNVLHVYVAILAQAALSLSEEMLKKNTLQACSEAALAWNLKHNHSTTIQS